MLTTKLVRKPGRNAAGTRILATACVAVAWTQMMAADFVWLDSKRIDSLTKPFRLAPHDAWVSRNEAGTVLFLSVPDHGGSLVLSVSARGTLTNWVAGGKPVVTDEGKTLCFLATSNRNLVFPDGPSIPQTAASRYGFSPGRDYFFRTEGTNWAGVFRTADPLTPAFTPRGGFFPQSIFTSANRVFLFGSTFGPPPAAHLGAWGLVLSEVDGRLHLEHEVDLSRFGTVLDMDATRGLLIVDSKGELPHTWGLYNLQSGTFNSLGRCRGQGLFLDPKLRDYLENLWRGSKKGLSTR